MVMDELESALAQQAPPKVQDDPSLFELPPLIIDGIPTPVEKMTQAQLRAFIPLMLKYSTGGFRDPGILEFSSFFLTKLFSNQKNFLHDFRTRQTWLGSRFDASRVVAKRTSLGKRANGRKNRRRETENQLDTRVAKDRDQLLQISREGRSAAGVL